MQVQNRCGPDNHYWVYFANLTEVGTTVVVTDTLNGRTQFYRNPAGPPPSPVTDTSAFATCP